MAYSLPDKNSGMEAGKTGAVNGGPLAIGEALGRSVLGRGLGTAIGGIAVASAADGDQRDVMATIAVERGVSELMATPSGSSQTSRGRM